MSVEIHPGAIVSRLADIEPSVRGTRIEIAAGARVDSFVKIKPAGGSGDVRIGENSYINSGCVLYTGNGISIGKDVLIAANCTLAPTNHAFRQIDVPIRLQGFQASRGGIVIEDDVWIGANCVLLDGAYVETCCVIAAGSVVRGRLKAGCIYAGNPLKVIGKRT
ncbi:MAG: DapH/DapD/GlmU-related protein [Nitratireductor sp.]